MPQVSAEVLESLFNHASALLEAHTAAAAREKETRAAVKALHQHDPCGIPVLLAEIAHHGAHAAMQRASVLYDNAEDALGKVLDEQAPCEGCGDLPYNGNHAPLVAFRFYRTGRGRLGDLRRAGGGSGSARYCPNCAAPAPR